MNLRFDIIELLREFVKPKWETLNKYSLGHRFEELENKANEVEGHLEYLNELTNGAVDIVAENTKENYNKVKEEFIEHYFSTKWKSYYLNAPLTS